MCMNNVQFEIMYVTFYNFVSDWNNVHKRQDEAFNLFWTNTFV